MSEFKKESSRLSKKTSAYIARSNSIQSAHRASAPDPVPIINPPKPNKQTRTTKVVVTLVVLMFLIFLGFLGFQKKPINEETQSVVAPPKPNTINEEIQSVVVPPKPKTLEEVFPMPWAEDVSLGITQALVAKKIRICGEYKYRQMATDTSVFLVACRPDSNGWTYFKVDTDPHFVSNPYTALTEMPLN